MLKIILFSFALEEKFNICVLRSFPNPPESTEFPFKVIE